ncbi:MAG: hypothetical protein ABL921_16440 [Pirellula sp.]
MLISPYHRYHLFRNPFGELSREERADLAIVDTERWIALLDHSGIALQFIGECGNGKTTHLLAISKAVPDAKYVYLPESGPLPNIPNQRPMIVDEAQRLSKRQLHQVLKRGGPLVLGTHVDLSDRIRLAGLNPHTFYVANDFSSERLMAIMNRRIESSSIGNGIRHKLAIAHAEQLNQTFGTDIRAMEHYLYDRFQQAAMNQYEWPFD